MRKSTLAAKIGLVMAAVVAPLAAPASAQLAVVDVANVHQSTTTALQSVAAVQKQIQQYQTQLQQYQNMLTNTLAPEAYIWSQAQSAMNGLQNTTNSLNFLSTSSGGIDNYLNQFKNPNFYRSSPCFSANGCSAAEYASVKANQDAKQATAMATNEAVMRGIQQQQGQLQTEAATLQTMQRNAQGAQGQAQALGYANQFAANQANQLMQIRSLLMNQQAAATALQQAQADQLALQTAASAQRNGGGANDNETGQQSTLGSGRH